MSETRASVNCINHPPMSASMRCDSCATVYCRLCFRIENNMYVCKTCGTLGKPATEGQIRTEKDRRSTQFLKRVSGVGPAVGAGSATGSGTATSAPPQKSLRELQASGSRKAIGAKPIDAGFGSMPPPPIPPNRAAQPQEESSNNEAPPRENEPQFLKKGGPFFCKNHPQTKATRRCGMCVEYYCSECVKKVNDNPICPDCSMPLKALSLEDQGIAPESFIDQLAGAFAYPLKGLGIWVLLFCPPLIWALSFAGLKGTLIGLGFAYAYFFKIVCASASGRESPPDAPSMANFLSEVGWPLIYFLCAKVMSIGPAILYLVLLCPVSPIDVLLEYAGNDSDELHVKSTDEELEDSPELALLKDPQADLTKHSEEVDRREKERLESRRSQVNSAVMTFSLLALLGAAYYPMAIMALALHRSISVLNPLFILQSIGKLGTSYIAPLLIYFIAEVAAFFTNALSTDIMLIGSLIGTAIWMYFMMVEMNVLGLLYYTQQRKLNWFGGAS